jgi:hypothetical protein
VRRRSRLEKGRFCVERVVALASRRARRASMLFTSDINLGGAVLVG